MFSVFFLYSIFNMFLLCLLSFISFLRQMVVFSQLFRVLALSFLPLLSETVSLYHSNHIAEEDQQFQCTVIFCVLFSIPFVLTWFCHSFTLIKFSFLH